MFGSLAALTGCWRIDPVSPPQISAADLHRIEQIDFAPFRPHVPPACNVRSGTAGLSYWAGRMTASQRLMKTFGFHRLSHWRKLGAERALVDPVLEAELRRTSTRIMLDMPASRIANGSAALPPNCTTGYVLSAPSYSGSIAFIDRDFLCDWCGSGATLATKYDGKAWQLVAIHGNWSS